MKNSFKSKKTGGLRKNSIMPMARLKKQADAVLSIWVRNQGAVEGWNTCFACGVRYPVAKLQCGHFFSRTHSATRYHEDNVRPECFACNVWKRGNIAAYSIHLQEEIGFERIKALERLKNSIFKLSPAFLQGIIDKYK